MPPDPLPNTTLAEAIHTPAHAPTARHGLGCKVDCAPRVVELIKEARHTLLSLNAVGSGSVKIGQGGENADTQPSTVNRQATSVHRQPSIVNRQSSTVNPTL